MTSQRVIPELVTYVKSFPDKETRDSWIVSVASISYILNVMRGHRRPSAKLALKIAQATNWSVTPHQILPSIFVNTDDGIPKKISKKVNSNLPKTRKDTFSIPRVQI